MADVSPYIQNRHRPDRRRFEALKQLGLNYSRGCIVDSNDVKYCSMKLKYLVELSEQLCKRNPVVENRRYQTKLCWARDHCSSTVQRGQSSNVPTPKLVFGQSITLLAHGLGRTARAPCQSPGAPRKILYVIAYLAKTMTDDQSQSSAGRDREPPLSRGAHISYARGLAD